MDIVFSATSIAGTASTSWSAVYDRAQLLLTLRQASARAASLGHAVLASSTQPVVLDDPLHIFSAFQAVQLGEVFFWARPSEQRALVGLGSTTTIETYGPNCVASAATIWRNLQQDAIIGQASNTPTSQTAGPLLFGGFAFDPLNTHTQLWQGFPDGLLILPHLLFHCDETGAALTINLLVQPSADCDILVDEVFAELQCVDDAIERVLQRPSTQPSADLPCGIHDLLPPAVWMQQVAAAVQTIRAGAFEKVVLARAMQVVTEANFDIVETLHRLRANYPGAYVFAIQRGQRYFVGATPERLICGADGQIRTMALAGSAPRGATAAEDQLLGDELLQNPKNLGEHAVVVSTIRQALADVCSRVWVGDAPHLLKLKNIQHLQTPITGNLLPGRSILEAIEDLHPTPAVGGFPRLPALTHIREHEQLDRGWYAGPIGWIGTSGNGEFAVALRSALVEGQTATLFAGCGIVADSMPASELAESLLKLQVMLRGLGCEG